MNVPKIVGHAVATVITDEIVAGRGPAVPEFDQGGQVVSDGGSTAYYQLPTGAVELGDLIEHKGMGFNRGNIFKACYRLGEKAGNEAAYDIRKIIWFAERMLAQVLRDPDARL